MENKTEKLNRKDIIEIISDLDLKNKYHFVFMGGSLTIMGIREFTNDLDLGVTSDEFVGLQRKFRKDNNISTSTLGNGKFDLIINNHKVEIFNLDNEIHYDNIDTIKCQKLNDIVELKKRLNRPKDEKDLKLIHEFINR